jgi:hypothetical protein
MKGSIGYAKHVKRYYVAWYHEPIQKTLKLYRYKGEPLYDRRMAEKLIACMQADIEKGVFRIETYTKQACDVIPYLRTWVESVRATITPATYKDYWNSIENHLVPFFETKSIQLHEIQYDTLMELLSHIRRDGKGKMNVLYCLHACLDYAWRSRRIPAMPPFPKKKAYGIIEPTIRWVPEERQLRIIEAIPLEHQPIFWWLKYHLRRPAEAMALLKDDYQGGVFIVQRGFSARVPVDRTKTGEIHVVPTVSQFEPYIQIEKEKQKRHGIISPFFFVHPHGKTEGKHYTHKSLGDLWKKACAEVGESIQLYAGTKHSSCSQLINEYGYSLSQVQTATDHARLESVKRYAKVEVSARKAILEKMVGQLRDSGTILERESRKKSK